LQTDTEGLAGKPSDNDHLPGEMEYFDAVVLLPVEVEAGRETSRWATQIKENQRFPSMHTLLYTHSG
jgi:hypothetical protein